MNITLPYPPSVNSMYENWVELSILGRKYAVSNMAGVKRMEQDVVKKNGVTNHFCERRMKPSYAANGRAHVVINSKSFILSNLVALAFLGDRPIGTVVSHKDGDKLNDHADNLEYISVSRNGLNIADGVRKDNKTGIRGVFYEPNGKRWIGYINVDKNEYRYSALHKMQVVAWRKIMEILVRADRRAA